MEGSVQAAVALAVQTMSNHLSTRGRYGCDTGHRGKRVLVSDPSGVGPGDQKLSRRDGSDSGLGEQARSGLGDQLLEQRQVVGGLCLESPDSPRHLPQNSVCHPGLNVASCGAKPETSCYQVLTSESNQAFANRVRGTHHQGIELVQGLAVGADRTLSGTEQNSNRLSVAPLPWNRVVLPSEGFASHLDGVQLV